MAIQLQCSCLENPRDRRAWWAAVYGVTQSRTRLKWLSSSSSSRVNRRLLRKKAECVLGPHTLIMRKQHSSSLHLPRKVTEAIREKQLSSGKCSLLGQHGHCPAQQKQPPLLSPRVHLQCSGCRRPGYHHPAEPQPSGMWPLGSRQRSLLSRGRSVIPACAQMGTEDMGFNYTCKRSPSVTWIS